MWIPRWRRLAIYRGPVVGPMVRHGAWGPMWTTGSSFPSFDHPSPWNLLFGRPAVRRLRELNTKQDTETILRDSGGDTHYSYACYKGTHLPSSTWSSDWERGKISCASTLESGMLVNFTPIDGTVAYRCGFRNRIPYLIWLSNEASVLCWPENSGPQNLGLPLQLRDSYGIQMGPRRWGEPGRESMGNLLEAQYLYSKIC
jgi:hypothetical protein